MSITLANNRYGALLFHIFYH